MGRSAAQGRKAEEQEDEEEDFGDEQLQRGEIEACDDSLPGVVCGDACGNQPENPGDEESELHGARDFGNGNGGVRDSGLGRDGRQNGVTPQAVV